MITRAVRGATCVSRDDKGEISSAVVEMLSKIFEANAISEDQLVSILFTSTSDLTSEFPATAARELGLADTPLICAKELEIEGALARTIRVLIHFNTELSKQNIKHVYIRGAEVLRKDISQ
jgi:chorismate mutase